MWHLGMSHRKVLSFPFHCICQHKASGAFCTHTAAEEAESLAGGRHERLPTAGCQEMAHTHLWDSHGGAATHLGVSAAGLLERGAAAAFYQAAAPGS